MKQVIINDQSYPLRFGLSVIRRFSAKMGFKTVNEFQTFIEGLGDDLTFEQMESVSLLLLLAIERGSEDASTPVKLTTDDILDLFLVDPSVIQAMMQAMTETFATGETSTVAKKKAAKKASAGTK